MKKIILFLSLLFLCSCAGYQVVETRYEPARGGIVSYKNNALSQSNREAALSYIDKFCGESDAKLISEGAGDKFAGFVSNGYGMMTAINTHLVYLNFRCEDRQPASAPTIGK